MNVLDYLLEANKNSETRKYFQEFKNDIFKHTLKWEGGAKLHNVVGDSGGWTLYGIAYNYNKEIFNNFDDFKDTTYEEAAAIAYVKYYLKAEVYRVPKNCRLVYFDTAYNTGVSRAVKIMQKCIGVTADGNIGPITRGRMMMCNELCLFEGRNGWYNYLVRTNSKFLKFIKGWMNRSKAIFDID